MGDFLKSVTVDTLHFHSDIREEAEVLLKPALVPAREGKVRGEYLKRSYGALQARRGMEEHDRQMCQARVFQENESYRDR
jgi:hypothetical protein